MIKKRVQIASFSILLLLSLFSVDLSASGFIGAGIGFEKTEFQTSDINRKDFVFPVILVYQYAPEYRDLWMFNSSFSYTIIPDKKTQPELWIGTAGIMYIKPFTYYRSNITQTVFSNNSCLGTILLPFTVIRDTLINVYQYLIPQHPLIFLDMAIIKETNSVLKRGFSTGVGLTSGAIDFKFRYTQNLNYDNGIKRDFYAAGFEFTLNIPLQQKFLRTESLID